MSTSSTPARNNTSTRPARFVVLAIGHFVFAGVALLWTVALVGGLAYASAAGSSAAGVATVWAVALLNVAKLPLLVSGALGLLRCSRWGWYATVSYGVVAVGEAVILYSTGASLLLVTILLMYPVAVLILVTAPVARKAAGLR